MEGQLRTSPASPASKGACGDAFVVQREPNMPQLSQHQHAQPGISSAATQPTPESPHPRPFATYYYDARASVSDWSGRGRAASLRGAVLAATRRLIDRRAFSALIHDEDGVVIAQVRWARGAIHITGVFDHATLQ